MMKKLVFTLLTVLASGAAYALPVGNPAEASLLCDGIFWDGTCCRDMCDPCLSWCDVWSVRIGFYGDYVFNRNMEVDARSEPDIFQTTLSTNAGYIAFNLWNRVDVFTTLGASTINIKTPRSAFSTAGIGGPSDDYIFLHTETDFSWSIGARGTVWECGCFSFGVEGQYFSTCPDIDFIRDESDSPFYFKGLEELEYYEWQVGVGVSYTIPIYGGCECGSSLVPYIAIKWAGAKGEMNNFVVEDSPTLTMQDIETKKYWGYAVGFTLVASNRFGFTVEGRYADEKALYLNGQIRF